ncbi:MAG: response regulator [Nitrospirae bacterium]|nr:response regulator [Nitrospirota bacterium]
MLDINTAQIPYELTAIFVEDDDVARSALERFLQKQIKTVHFATNGKEGLELYQRHKPELVITDIRMPFMDGLKMSEAIKEIDATVPIIVTTSHNDFEFLMSAIDIGIDKYILKPVKLNSLAQAIKECVRVICQQKEINKLNLMLHDKIRAISEKTAYLNGILSSSMDIAIIATDLDFNVRYYNPAAQRMFDLKAETFANTTLFTVLDGLQVECQRFELAIDLVRERRDSSFVIVRTDRGQPRYLDFRLSGIWSDDGFAGLCMMTQDITERMESEERIRASLREKEVLLREVHHRVKNNMQVISSLLRLQARYIKDAKLSGLFRDSEYRIKSMALIHEKLYKSSDLASIDFADYIKSLVGGLFSTYGLQAGKVNLSIAANNIILGIDTAIPCGLVINELISNSLKYGFSTDRGDEQPLRTITSEISIKLYQADEEYYELVVGDNGIGLPPGMDYKNTESLGLQLVASLVQEQLHGSITLQEGQGTTFCIRFKELKYKKRI